MADPRIEAAKILIEKVFVSKKAKKILKEFDKYSPDLLASIVGKTLHFDKASGEYKVTQETKDLLDGMTKDTTKKLSKREKEQLDAQDKARERLSDPKSSYNKATGDYVWQDIIAPALSTGARELAKVRTAQLGVLPAAVEAAASRYQIDPRVQQGTSLGQISAMSAGAIPAMLRGVNTAKAVGTQAIANTFSNTLDHAVGEARKEDEIARTRKMVNDTTLANGGVQPVSAFYDLENRIQKNNADEQKRAAQGGGF